MHFNLGTIDGVVTVVWFFAFVALCVWAWSGRRRQDFDAAAQLPFDDAGDSPAEKRERSP